MPSSKTRKIIVSFSSVNQKRPYNTHNGPWYLLMPQAAELYVVLSIILRPKLSS